MFCPYCGHEIDDDSVFCSFCGENIVESNKAEKAQPSNGKKEPSSSDESKSSSSKTNNAEKSNVPDVLNASSSVEITDSSDTATKKPSFISENKKTLIIAGIFIVVMIVAVIVIIVLTSDSNSSGDSSSSSHDDYNISDSYDDHSDDDNDDSDDEEETSEEETTSESNGYIDSFDDLDEDVAEQFIAFARGYYESEDFGQNEHPSLEYVGNIVLVNKKSDEGGISLVHNKLVVIYKVSMRITHSYGDSTTDFYWFMGFNNVRNNFEFPKNYQVAKDHPNFFRPNNSVQLVGPNEDPWEYRGQYSISDLKYKELNDPDFNIVEENIDY